MSVPVNIPDKESIVALKAIDLFENQGKSFDEIAKILELENADDVYDRILDFYLAQY